MPIITIDGHRDAYTAQQKRAVSDALHAAMQEVLRIPNDDRMHFFHELDEASIHHEDVVFGVPRTRRMLFVTLSFNHRPASVKERLFAALVRHLAAAGVGEDEVAFRVIETDPANWWAAGRVVDPVTGYDARMTVPAEA